MTSHISFIRKASTFNIQRIKNDVHQYVENIHNPELDHSSKSGSIAAITGLRNEYMLIAGTQKNFRRVYVKCDDSGKYAQVGWILTVDTEACMVCNHKLSGKGSKHHCRACGNVVCENCSTARALVRPIEEIGPVRVCSMCHYGQSPVDAIPNIRQGRPVIGEFGEDEDSDEESHDPISLWEYGKIEIVAIHPAMVIKTRRTNRTVVYVNLCSCPQVPYNPPALEHENGIIYLVVGEMGITSHDHTVYDIAVNPIMITAAQRNAQILTNLCQQALIAITLHRHEKDFHVFTIDQSHPSHYVPRKAKLHPQLRRNSQSNKKDQESENPAEDINEELEKAKVLAIPSPLAFQTLGQVATSLSDALNPEPIALNGLNSEKRHEQIRHHADGHRDRITAKLLCRTISQLKEIRLNETPTLPEDEVTNRDSSESQLRRPSNIDISGTPHNNNNNNGYRLSEDVYSEIMSPSNYSTSNTPGGSGRRGNKPDNRPWNSIVLSPNPGFVIKTWKADDPDEKVFINVFHHEMIDALLERDEYELPFDQQPFCAYGDLSRAEDKNGSMVPVYCIIIGSSYFMESYITSEKKITDEDYVEKIIDKVNAKFNSGLNPTDSVILRVKGGYKGLWKDSINFQYRLPSRQFIVKRKNRKQLADDVNNPRYQMLMSGNNSNNSSAASTPTTVGSSLPPKHPRSSITSPMSYLTHHQHENESVHSAQTGSSRTSRRSIRASITEALGFTSEPHDFILTPDMFVYNPKESIDWQDQVVLKHYSIEKPDVLLGWQITRKESEHFVITGVRKTALHKTEYRLSSLNQGEIWSKLKRGEKKSGYPFRPNRKVLFLTPGDQK